MNRSNFQLVSKVFFLRVIKILKINGQLELSGNQNGEPILQC
jgi:hypothetical protein